jgi:MFS family permease
MGLGESVTFPAANVLMSKWAPGPEKSVMINLMNSGAYLGTAFAFPISGALLGVHTEVMRVADKDHPGSMKNEQVSTSWPLVFYFFGALGCVWFVLWEYYGASSPQQHRFISDSERDYIARTAGTDPDVKEEKVEVTKSASPPWTGLFTHPAALTTYFNHFAMNWGGYTLMTYLPKYLKVS